VVHPKRGRTVGDESIELDEGPGIEQLREALAGGQLSRGVLSGDPVRPASLLNTRTSRG